MSPRHRSSFDGLAPGLVAVAFVILAALVWDAFRPTTVQAAPAPQRGTVAYCKARASGIAERACIVRVVFGPRHARKAVAVAYCESRIDPRARNGQYRGAFQMGARERARYGHGRTVEAQARAAKRYHAVAGWGPWSCS
jgi:hypothetical protein